MAKRKRFQVRVECPECACGELDHILPENWREQYARAEDTSKVVIDCPSCGAKVSGPVSEVAVEE